MFHSTCEIEVESVEEQRYHEFSNALRESDVLALAKIDYTKWVKWVLPKLLILACICWASLVVLTTIGWQ